MQFILTTKKQRRNVMNNWTRRLAVLNILSLLLIAACATSTTSQKHTISTLSPENKEEKACSFSPEIPINHDNAFFPLLYDGSGVFYSWFDCRILGMWCDIYRQIDFKFDNKCHMQWFINNDYGLQKRQSPL